MSSIFSLKNVEESWNVLMSSSSTPQMRNTADKFLIEFKKSEDLVDICSELILNPITGSSTFLGAHFLYLYIQENINIIIECTEKYLKLKNLLLYNLIHKCGKFPLIVIKRICYSLSIILVLGSVTVNTCLIEEIIEFGKSSITNCYISVIILNSLYFEFVKLELNNEGMKMKITNYLNEKMTLVLEFMNFLLENFNLSEDSKNQSNSNHNNLHLLENETISAASKITVDEIKSEILDLIQSTMKLNVNILFIPRIFHTLLNSFNPNNAEKISFIISDSVKHLSSASFHSKEYVFDIEELVKAIPNEHLQILEGLVMFIEEFLNNKIKNDKIFNQLNFNIPNINSNNSDQDREKLNTVDNMNSNKLDSDRIEILAALAFIFNSILKNYVYLIFLDNKLSQIIYDNFFFFLSCKNRRVSAKMFMPLEEISSFLRETEFENYPQRVSLNPEKTSDQLKKEISLFLIDVTGLIMFNCKFQKLSIPILKKEMIISNFFQLELEEENDWDSNDSKFLSLSEYRLQASEAYFDIFSVFVENLRKEGITSFFSYLDTIIDCNNLLNPFESNRNALVISEKEKKEKVYLIEVIVHLLKSIVYLVTQEEGYIELLLNIALKIFGTQVIYDEFILCSFIQFLNEILDLVNKNKTLLKNTMELFALSMKNRQLQYISAQSIEIISEYCTEPQEEMFYKFYDTYIENFDLYEANSLSYLSSALLKFVWSNYNNNQQRNIQYSEEQLLYFIELILTPVTSSLLKVNDFIGRPDALESLKSNQNELNNEIIKQLKKTIIKNLSIYKSIFYLGHRSSQMFVKIFSLFYNNFKDILDFCHKYLNYDSNFNGVFFDTIKGILLVLKEFNNNHSFELDILCNLSDSLIHLQAILAYYFIKYPDYNKCLENFNGLLENLITVPLDKKDHLFSNCLMIIEKTEDVSKNFQDLAFLESFPSEYFKFWVLILNSGMNQIFFDIYKFNTFLDVLLGILLEYLPDITNKNFNFLQNCVSLFNALINVNGIFPQEFYEDKAKKILKFIFTQLEYLGDSDIKTVVPLITRIVIVDGDKFIKSMIVQLNQDTILSKLSLECKLKIVNYMVTKSNHDSEIEQLLLKIRSYKKTELSLEYLEKFLS